ncbi:MAG: hypothetical protein Q9213_000700 [Squamulea squamosa]
MTSKATASLPSPRRGIEVPGTVVLGDGEVLSGIQHAVLSSNSVTAEDAATEYPEFKTSPAAEKIFKRYRDMQAGRIPLPTSPTQEFMDLTGDMWKVIRPYNVDTASDGTDLRTQSYNEVGFFTAFILQKLTSQQMYTDLVAGKYRACLALLENHLNSLYPAELNLRRGGNDLPSSEAIHYLKLCTMKMMIMPVAQMSQSEAWIRRSLTNDLHHCVMLNLFGTSVPAHINDHGLFYYIIFEEVQRRYLLSSILRRAQRGRRWS